MRVEGFVLKSESVVSDFLEAVESIGAWINPDLVRVEWFTRNFVEKPLQVLSLGGGVQSCAMLLMIGEGILEKPDIVIFADTGSEMPHTLDHLESVCRPYIEEVLQIPFAIVKSHRGSLHDDYMRIGSLPMVGVRSCTDNFKIAPQRKFMRLIVGRKNGVRLAEAWLGITTDESSRKPEVKSPREPKWVDLKYPLLDQIPTSRQECENINEKYGWNVAKSGCFCCPYSSTEVWRALRDNHPELFEICLEMERVKNEKRPGKWGLHREHPLSTIDDWELPESTCDSGGCFI